MEEKKISFKEEMVQMLKYALNNNIEITEKDIEKIRAHMRIGMSLTNDPNNKVFFVDMEILAPMGTKTILMRGVNYALKYFEESNE